MNLFEFIPSKNTKRLGIVSGLLLLGGSVMLLITIIFSGVAFRWVFQLLSICMFGLSIFLISRYVMRDYVYAVVSTDNGNDFTVTELQNKKKTTVCRISISNIEKSVVINEGDKTKESEIKALIKQGNYKKFNYCADIMNEKCVYVFADECGERVALKLSFGEELERVLQFEK